MRDPRVAAMYRAHVLGATLDEIAREHNLTAERVRQLMLAAGTRPRTRAEAGVVRRDRAAARARAGVELGLIGDGDVRSAAARIGTTAGAVRAAIRAIV